MASYTIELRHLCEYFTREEIENWFKSYELTDYLTQKQIESITNANLWNKDKLAKKIVDHYYLREIGFETPAMFKHYAKLKMQEIMEDYLPVIYSNSIEYDPLVNVDFTETFTREENADTITTGTSNSNSNSNSSGLNIGSDTPQTNINKNDILSGKYSSQANANENTNTVSDTTNIDNTSNLKNIQNYTKHQKGNSGISTTAQVLIEQYRNAIRAVDREIIEACNDLFMQIF